LEGILEVIEITRMVKGNLEGDDALRGVRVRGELSNFRVHTSGHTYFTLKDQFAALRCVMFRSRRAYLSLLCRDGDAVVATGSLGVYERDGTYQLYVEALELDGAGAIKEEYERLKARLEAEGLFHSSRKRPLPMLPRKVGVATSPTSAALRDIISVARRRYPNCHLVLAPVQVQGDSAPASIQRALVSLNQVDGVDVIIVGRGGGSQEDLGAFESEEVARAVFSSRVPVISAVGHQTDTTLADLVADARAPTPSAAAEMALPEKAHLLSGLGGLKRRLAMALERRRSLLRGRWEGLARSPALSRPTGRINQRRQQLDDLSARMERAMVNLLGRKTSRSSEMAARLQALSPLAVLARGYSIALLEPGRALLGSVSQASAGDGVAVVLRDGEVHCEVIEVIPKKEKGVDGH
jgi:exodeoxyribonuclease VII large subunit